MDLLFEKQQRLIEDVDMRVSRYIYNDIQWSARMFALVGPRGVGKTTMFLQHIKRSHNLADTLYVSADSTYFNTNTLIALADRFYKLGGRNLYIDEIHKYPNWSQELKEVYDSYPRLKIAFTGSSVLDITKGSYDLSRRAPIYHLQGLSFREYLHIAHGIEVPVHSLDDIVANRLDIKGVDHPLPLFAKYLKNGYYPFGSDPAFDLELEELINKTLEVDIPNFAGMTINTSRKLKQLLGIISESVPFKPVNQKIAEMVGVSRNNIADYFILLERAGLIAQLRNATGGIRGLGKTEKIYLDNPNLIYALATDQSNIGNIRETFFFNQMRVKHDVVSSTKGDFIIGNKTFEVGGRNKTQHQIQDVDNAFIVKDDIEYGHHNVLPLWAFGLTY